MSYALSFQKQVVTQLCQGACYSLTDRASKQDLDSVSRGKQQSKSTKTVLRFDNELSRYYIYRKGLWELQRNSSILMGNDTHTCLCSSVLYTAYWLLRSDILFLCRLEDLLNI